MSVRFKEGLETDGADAVEFKIYDRPWGACDRWRVDMRVPVPALPEANAEATDIIPRHDPNSTAPSNFDPFLSFLLYMLRVSVD
jgi:hypothetical protein